MPEFSYRLIRSKRLTSTTSISLHPDKGIIVRAPFWLPDFAVEEFVKQKTDWITKHLAKFSKHVPQKKYTHGEMHLYFGTQYPLQINQVNNRVRTSVVLQDNAIQVTVFSGHPTDNLQAEVRESLLRWYLETGISVITDRVNHYSQTIGVEYGRIDIKKVSTIWGSCSPGNHLSFNRKLIMAPPEIVDYVVIHEVSHLVHRNHSSRFWALVARLDPLYKQHRRWLRDNHMLLSI